jgi:hypothetical protein
MGGEPRRVVRVIPRGAIGKPLGCAADDDASVCLFEAHRRTEFDE